MQRDDIKNNNQVVDLVDQSSSEIKKEEPQRFRIKPNLQAQEAIARQIYIPKSFEGKISREIKKDNERKR